MDIMRNGSFYSFLAIFCLACASGEPRRFMEISSPHSDGYLRPAFEFGVADAGVGDGLNASEPTGANRTVLLIVGHQHYEMGFRRALMPPHRPAYEHLNELDDINPTALLAVWDGPGTDRDAQLNTLTTRRWPVIPFYRPDTNVTTVDKNEALANLRYLLEWLLNRSTPYRVDGKRLLAIDFSGHLEPYTDDIFNLIETTTGFVVWARVSDPDLAPPQAGGFWATCHGENQVVHERQIPCVGPKPPSGQGAAESNFANRLLEARWASDKNKRRLMVDGLGRWDNDGQLDSVLGSDTMRPVGLTGGRLVRAYGDQRVTQTSRLSARSRQGLFVSFFDSETALVGRSELMVEGRTTGLDVTLSPSSEYVRLLLNSLPFDLSPDTQCTVQGLSEGVSIEFRFTNGEVHTWRHRADGDFSILHVGSATRRVEDVIIVYRGVVAASLPSMRGLNCLQ